MFLFGIALLMLAILIHGALRMRSTKQKVSNKIEFIEARSFGSRTGTVVIDELQCWRDDLYGINCEMLTLLFIYYHFHNFDFIFLLEVAYHLYLDIKVIFL